MNLSSNKKGTIANKTKYVKRCSRFVTITLAILAFLLFPLFMELTEKTTIPSLIGGVAFITIAIFVIVDFFWFIITSCTETIFFSIFDSIFDRVGITLKHDVPGHRFNWFNSCDFIVEVFDASDDFTESVLCTAMDSCTFNLELDDKSFEDNIDNFYTWMNKFVMPEYESLMIFNSQKT